MFFFHFLITILNKQLLILRKICSEKHLRFTSKISNVPFSVIFHLGVKSAVYRSQKFIVLVHRSISPVYHVVALCNGEW